MKVGYVQFAPTLGNLDATLGCLEELLPRCAPAELIVLPELCNSGYNFASREQAVATAETVSDSRFVAFLVEHCRRHRCHIVSGLNEREGAALYNSAVFVGPNACIGLYRKLHLFYREQNYFEPGNVGLPVFDCGEAKIGMLVCFDWLFPEVWRVLALKSADIICHPCNLVLPGMCQRAIPIHAMINRYYIVTANRVGAEGDLAFTGASLIASPRGEVLTQAPPDTAHVSVVDVDLSRSRDKQITPMNHLINCRRPDQYGMLTE
jgi:predicted amidohydrolase